MLYFAPFLLTKMMTENFYVLKARALGTNVYTVKKAELEDDYVQQVRPVKVNYNENENGGKKDER